MLRSAFGLSGCVLHKPGSLPMRDWVPSKTQEQQEHLLDDMDNDGWLLMVDDGQSMVN